MSQGHPVQPYLDMVSAPRYSENSEGLTTQSSAAHRTVLIGIHVFAQISRNLLVPSFFPVKDIKTYEVTFCHLS